MPAPPPPQTFVSSERSDATGHFNKHAWHIREQVSTSRSKCLFVSHFYISQIARPLSAMSPNHNLLKYFAFKHHFLSIYHKTNTLMKLSICNLKWLILNCILQRLMLIVIMIISICSWHCTIARQWHQGVAKFWSGLVYFWENHYFGTIGNSQKWENKVFATGFILIPMQEAYIQVCIWKIWTHNLSS